MSVLLVIDKLIHSRSCSRTTHATLLSAHFCSVGPLLCSHCNPLCSIPLFWQPTLVAAVYKWISFLLWSARLPKQLCFLFVVGFCSFSVIYNLWYSNWTLVDHTYRVFLLFRHIGFLNNYSVIWPIEMRLHSHIEKCLPFFLKKSFWKFIHPKLSYERFSASEISRTFLNVEKESARRNARTQPIAALCNKNKQNFCFFHFCVNFLAFLRLTFKKWGSCNVRWRERPVP